MRAAFHLVGLLVAVGAAGPLQAAEADGCATFKWPVAREVQALGGDTISLASGDAYPALGRGVTLALKPQSEVAYAVPPARAPRLNPAYGGQLVLAEAKAGTVQVALSSDAWIDLVQDGKRLRSIGFSGQKGCPALRKSVRFAVQPGPVTISISDAPGLSIKLDIEPAE